MRSSITLLALIPLLAGSAFAGTKKIVRMPLFDGYEIKTLIGTPPQQAKLWLDTSTSLIAVPSGDSQNCDCTMCFEHGYSFASSESTSLQSAQGVGGDVVDTVQIGSIATQGMAIRPFDDNNSTTAFGVNRDPSSWWMVESAKGTWLDNIYGIYSRRERDSSTRALAQGRSGEITWGGMNDKYISGDVHWVAVDASYTGWRAPVTQILFNDMAFKNSQTLPTTVEFDTGSHNIFAPLQLVQSIATTLNGNILTADDPAKQLIAGTLIAPCTAIFKLTIELAGMDYTILGENLLEENYGNGLCSTSIVGGAHYDQTNTWILGTPFISQYYTVYRNEPPSVGIAILSPAATGATVVGEQQCATKTGL